MPGEVRYCAICGRQFHVLYKFNGFKDVVFSVFDVETETLVDGFRCPQCSNSLVYPSDFVKNPEFAHINAPYTRRGHNFQE